MEALQTDEQITPITTIKQHRAAGKVRHRPRSLTTAGVEVRSSSRTSTSTHNPRPTPGHPHSTLKSPLSPIYVSPPAGRRSGAAEGFSIPAQHEANKKKAASLGALIVKEFVDRGESARSANRPELQKMLTYIQEAGTSTTASSTNSTVSPATAPTTSTSTGPSIRRASA